MKMVGLTGRLLLLIFIAVSIVVLVQKFLVVSVDMTLLQENILLNRMVYSPSCLSYRDSAQNYRPGIINASRLRESTLDSCLYFGEKNNYAAANLSLVYLDSRERLQAYYNQQGYLLLYPKADLSGPGGATKASAWRYVQVWNGTVIRPALLYIDLVVPNE